MTDSWSTNQRKFIEWLATPKYERIPPTQVMFADTIGINAITLTRWKRLSGFREAVNARAREFVGEGLPEVYGALMRKAESGDVNAIKLVLELTGEYVPTQKQETTGEATLRIIDARE